jgi:hypothetical protein
MAEGWCASTHEGIHDASSCNDAEALCMAVSYSAPVVLDRATLCKAAITATEDTNANGKKGSGATRRARRERAAFKTTLFDRDLLLEMMPRLLDRGAPLKPRTQYIVVPVPTVAQITPSEWSDAFAVDAFERFAPGHAHLADGVDTSAGYCCDVPPTPTNEDGIHGSENRAASPSQHCNVPPTPTYEGWIHGSENQAGSLLQEDLSCAEMVEKTIDNESAKTILLEKKMQLFQRKHGWLESEIEAGYRPDCRSLV